MPVIGIDLGTSNSCAAVVINNRPQVILDDKGRSTLPSIMAINRNGQFFVGHLAKAQMAIQPETTIHSAKRLLGQRYNDPNVQQLLPALSYHVVPLDDGMAGVSLSGQNLSPTEISAAVLTKIKSLAEAALKESVEEAIISVPAHFNDYQRRETKRAAEIAGIRVRRLINEPTAAALAYGFGTNANKTVAVFDFGGGTFDISILEIGDGVYNVLGTGSDIFLGGNDFNQAIAEWLFAQFKKKYGISLNDEPTARQRVLDAAEYAKIQLSSAAGIEAGFADIELKQIAPAIDPKLTLSERLSCRQFESICEPLADRSIRICESVFESAGLTQSMIDEVVLVGGSTRMPLIRRKVEKWFGKRPNTSINPDEAVGIGAAIQAMSLAANSRSVLLLDVLPLTISIENAGGVCIPLIPKYTKIPYHTARIFTTNHDRQDSVVISIYQGEGRHVSENTRLAAFELSGIRQAKRMEPRIEVSIDIDVDGILSVTAIDLDTHQSQSIQVVDLNTEQT